MPFYFLENSMLLFLTRAAWTAARTGFVLALAAVALADDPCPVFTISGTVSPGDGSTMPGGYSLYTITPDGMGQAQFMGAFPAGAMYSQTFQPHNEDYDVAWFAVSGGYFQSPIGGTLSCHPNPANPGCGTCSGGFDLKLYAGQGAIDGTVKVSPTPPTNLAGIPVSMSRTPQGGGVGAPALTDAAGHFEFRAQGGLERSNRWGVGVDPHYSPEPHSATGDATYYLSVGSTVSDPVTIHSSELKSVNLKVPAARAGGAGDPGKRGPGCGSGGSGGAGGSGGSQGPGSGPGNGGAGGGGNSPGPDEPCTNKGKPINVLTGNVFFDQTDVAIPGIQGLVFKRSYNSLDAASAVTSDMSRGWSHSYSRSLSFPDAISIDFRSDEAVPVYYQDLDGDLVFDPALPSTARSRVIKTGSTYVHPLLSGRVLRDLRRIRPADEHC